VYLSFLLLDIHSSFTSHLIYTYQVIAWLNKQVNKSSSNSSSGGVTTTWQRGLEAAATNTHNSSMTTRALPTPATSNAAALPTPLTTNSQASSAALSRLLPNNAVATPYQRLYVTPDLKPGISVVSGGSGMPQLHPGPTPYSMPPQRPT